MEEKTKEDMSTEQILSSIRNILSDEKLEESSNVKNEGIGAVLKDIEQGLQAKGEEMDTASEQSVVEELDVQDDVFDLAPAMIVDVASEDEIFDLNANEVLDLNSSEVVEQEDEILDLSSSEVVALEDEILDLNTNEVVEAVASQKADVLPISKVEEPEELKVEEPVLEDVASNIISAFSNLFNAYSPAKKTINSKVSAPAYKDGELKAQVQKTVENWVVENIDSDLNKIVNDEVALQVRVWLDENLPTLIQSSINQELERVMAKVDKAQ